MMADVTQHPQDYEGHRNKKSRGHEIPSHSTRRKDKVYDRDIGDLIQRSKKFFSQASSPSRSLRGRDSNRAPPTGQQNMNYCDSTNSSHSRHRDSRKRNCSPATPSCTPRHGQDSQTILSPGPEPLKSKVALVSSRRKPLSNPYQSCQLSCFNQWSSKGRTAESEQLSRKLTTFSQDLLELSRKHTTFVVKRQQSKSTSVSGQHHLKRKKVDDKDNIDKIVSLRDLSEGRDSYYKMHTITKTETIVHKRRCPYPSPPSHPKSMLMPPENSNPAIDKMTRRGMGPILPEKLLSNYMNNVDGENLISTTVPEAKDKLFTQHQPQPARLRHDARMKTFKRKIKRRSAVGGVFWAPIVFSIILFSCAVKWMLD